MKKKYVFGASFDTDVTLEVDFDLLTPELADMINNFWVDSEDMLEVSADVFEAVARRAASIFLAAAFEGCTIEQAQTSLDDSEGWPPAGEHGIRLVNYNIPDICADLLELNSIIEVEA